MRIAILTFILASTTTACASHHEGHHAPAAPGAVDHHASASAHAAPASTTVAPPANAVQAEMRLLNDAWTKSLTASALGQLEHIPHWFHAVHEARAATEKALESGAYKPAKGDVAAFMAMDKAFHDQIEKVVEAAQKGDAAAVQTGLTGMMPSCVACHAAHRAP
jgi:anthranilate/para-aminobenzoate synthase component I